MAGITVSALDFFRKRGLVLKPEFLAASHCRALCAHMRGAARQPAEVYGDTDVDTSARHAWDVSVTAAIAGDLVDALARLRMELADRFAIPLAPCTPPGFLLVRSRRLPSSASGSHVGARGLTG